MGASHAAASLPLARLRIRRTTQGRGRGQVVVFCLGVLEFDHNEIDSHGRVFR
jgi:hypothetical protein